LAQHAFFFNPVVHLAMREYALAREAACDAAVLSGHRHAPQDYGRLLLQLGVAARPCAGVAGASPTFHLLKRRLTMLQHATSPSHAGMLGLSIVVAIIGVLPYRIVAQPAAISIAVAQAGFAVEGGNAPIADALAVPFSAGTNNHSATTSAQRAAAREQQARIATVWWSEQQRAQARFRVEQQEAQSQLQAEQEAAQASLRTEQEAARASLHTERDAAKANLRAEQEAAQANLHAELQAAQADQRARMEAHREDHEAQRAQMHSDEAERAEPADRDDPAALHAGVPATIRGA
jgi:hypothetical protein